MSRTHRILCIAASDWICFERLPLYLQELGFEIAVLAPDGTVFDALDFSARFFWGKSAAIDSLQSAIDSFAPDLLIFLDEKTIRFIGGWILARDVFVERNRTLLERSLGQYASFPARLLRRSLIALPEKIPTPPTIGVEPLARLLDFGAAQNWQCVFKTEYSTAGAGVRRSNDEKTYRYWAQLVLDRQLEFIVQRFIDGRIAMRTAIGSQGVVLAALSFEKLQRNGDFGYATVVQPIAHPLLAQAVAAVAQTFGLSGFFSCDFIIENQTGRVFLLELNPRPITGYHFAARFGIDVGEAVRQLIESRPQPQQDRVLDARPVAIFPREHLRDRQSPWLSRALSDAPENYPKLMAYYRERIQRELAHAAALKRQRDSQ